MKNWKTFGVVFAVLFFVLPLVAAARSNNRNNNRNNQNQIKNLQQQNQKLQRQQQQLMAQQWQQKTLEQLENSLELDDSQQAKVRPMLAGMAKQIEQLNSNKQLNPQAKNARLQQLYGATWTKIAALLTPQQRDTIQQNQLADNLGDELKLSKDQEEKIHKILRAQVEDDYQLRDDKTLSEDDKNLKSQEIDADTWAQVEDILKPAQQQKLAELRADDSLKNLSDAVTLSRDQQAQLKPALVELNSHLMKVRADKTLSLADRRLQIANISTATWVSIRRMLTAEQQDKFDAAQAQKQAAQQAALQPPKKGTKNKK